MPKSFYARFSIPILMVFLFAAPLLLQGARLAVRSNTNKVQDWLPKSFAETIELRWFRKHFVADQFVVISWDGCTLGDDPRLPDAKPDDRRIERLAKLLRSDKVARKTQDGEVRYFQLFKSVTTARRIPHALTTGAAEVAHIPGLKRLQH